MTDPGFVIGEVLTVPHPFVRDTYERHEHDGEEWISVPEPSWKPGIRAVHDYCGEVKDWLADAMGAQVLTIHGIYKPEGRYAARVFYTRKWVDPEGREFGKGQLRIRGIASFKAIANGYRVRFTMAAGGSPSTDTQPDKRSSGDGVPDVEGRQEPR